MSAPNPVPFFDLSRHGERPVVIERAGENYRSISYAELNRWVECFVSNLPARRQLVFILAANSLTTLVAYLACLRADHVALLLDRQIEQAQLDSLKRLYRPNWLVFGDRSPDSSLMAVDATEHPLHPDLALLLSTSGSTGSPKLVRLSRRNLQANAESICSYLPIRPDHTAITALPICYSYGLSIINSHLLSGARLALSDWGLHSREFWTLFKEAEVSSFSGVPLSFSLLQQLRFERMELPAMRYITCAGGALKPAQWHYLEQLAEEKGWPVYAMYGQTEATARMAYLPPEDFVGHIGCIGRAIPGGAFYLRDAVGDPITREEQPGELCYRGANVMMGYAEQLDDLGSGEQIDELASGDLALRRGDYFYITGRLKRFIKIASHRINLDELEQQFARQELPLCALGEDDALQIAVRSGSIGISLEQLAQSIGELLQINPRYICIRQFEQLPQLVSGKFDYRRMAEVFHDAA